MFESMLGIGQEENNAAKVEEKLIDKQLGADHTKTVIANATDANSDLTYIEQRKATEDLVKWQQDLEPELIQFQHDLRNEYFDDTQNKWLPKRGMHKGKIRDMPPLCNEFCVQKLTSDIRPLLSKNVIMSNFQEERILKILKRTVDVCIIDLGLYRTEYEIEYNHISSINSMIKNLVTPASFRALNNGERNHLNTVNRRIESVTGNTDEPKKRMLGLFG